MEIEKLKELLHQALQQSLPGKEAHLKMSPQPVDMRRFSPKTPENHRKSGVLLLFYPQMGKSFFPLIKRPVYPGVHSGQVALPGGKFEPGDPDVIFTALREAEEEIGIDAGKVEVLGRLSDLYIPTSNFLVSPVVGFIEESPRFVPEEKEVSRIITTGVQTIFQQEIIKRTHLELGGGVRLETPYFDIDGEIVWGATAMILSELRDLLEEKKG
ncbi:coenzyme A pyrophosphatase [Algoriphagus sp. AK58]|nr:coenzyme A pyrophosphatase [Algoriphagus sp. AK58]